VLDPFWAFPNLFRLPILARLRWCVDKVRVLVANRPRLMREAVRTALSRHADMEVVGEIEDELEILTALERTQAHCLIIAQEELGRRPPICDFVFDRYPHVKILAVAPGSDDSVFYWVFMEIRLSRIETSEEGVINALRGNLEKQSLSGD
jgi:DNA-binding NarL/FixJ family response regulator